jgi:polyisoprenoid-binding protein YceI
MMVTYVRGAFKDVHGTLEFDPEDLGSSSVEVVIDAKGLWSGDADRDAHLLNADFLDVENHPKITFKGSDVELDGGHDFLVTGDLTIRGVTRQTTLRVRYLGQWATPFWVGDEDKGPKARIGFVATTRINRHDFAVRWNASLDRGGVVVGDTVEITIDAEALLDS